MIAGDPALGRELEAHRDRYVYGPEPFDLECSRRLRRLQVEQLVQPGTINAKYSPGALVDVEYFVQALQVSHGSRDESLRSPNTLRALLALGVSGVLPAGHVVTLRASYLFFRMLIDALRVVRGHAKDLTLPPFDSDEFVLLSRRMRALSRRRSGPSSSRGSPPRATSPTVSPSSWRYLRRIEVSRTDHLLVAFPGAAHYHSSVGPGLSPSGAFAAPMSHEGGTRCRRRPTTCRSS